MKTNLSESLRLNVPRNDPFIRTLNILAVVALFLFAGYHAFAAEEPKPDPVAALTKERDELKTQVAQLQASNQYLSLMAERNLLGVQLLQSEARAGELQKQLDSANTKVVDLQKKVDELTPKPAPDKK